ncbi:hypothetical protein [Roseisolibacter agri]|uniref:Lipoprotein n=1 Tax=Roseisolibacter agri TaxID=2014610 RepID=A0AA37Q180_9BACT|nr:hypothetical protein [Roseisolibacter agri]GLC24634.1 hypothetical protein rosag_11470 [Roseisolibacter agri]
MHANRFRLVAAILFVAACGEPRPIWHGEATLSAAPLAITPARPLEAPGPTSLVCLIPAVQGLRGVLDTLFLPDGGVTRVRVVLITPEGVRDSLWGTGVWSERADSARGVPSRIQPVPVPPTWEPRGEQLCLWQNRAPTPERTIIRVELRSDRALPIRGVGWWSGEPPGLL